MTHVFVYLVLASNVSAGSSWNVTPMPNMDVCEQLPPEAYTVADDHTTFCWLQHEMAPETDLKKATAKKGEV